MGSSDGDGPRSSTKQMERQRSQGDVSISSCQSIVICIVLGNVFLESVQAHIEVDINIRAVEGSNFFLFLEDCIRRSPAVVERWRDY